MSNRLPKSNQHQAAAANHPEESGEGEGTQRCSLQTPELAALATEVLERLGRIERLVERPKSPRNTRGLYP
jgi:hypothetical protein